MSYWFGVDIDTGGAEPHHIDVSFMDVHPALRTDGIASTVAITPGGGYSRCGNYTSNVSPMWTRCLTAVAGEETRLRDLAGRRCGDLIGLLDGAVRWSIDHLDELRALNPPNGWGNAEGAIT